ncbi:hypothetical protein [Melittangium boletus]|uniref:Outer membrane protein beta-barrel domain-containing protein n=1 Tax=Melittangium boletus DSM 14713 TaxID=1294270 RepID=A0A250IRK1_9BACT|nr:hypothetical protein [Melittangium boletus]ATB34369.1 hypothetical protein MEBOL_007871 [Melittangium boletus DSM 14713]
MRGTLAWAGLVSVVMGSTGAHAAPPSAPPPGRMQGVGDVDARLMLNADILLAFVNGGVGADVGVAKLGPGVLSLGGEFEAGTCVTACLALNLATGWSFRHLYYAPHARLTYHLLPAGTGNLEKADLYGLLLGGVTFTTTRVAGDSSGTEFEYKGSDVGPSVGLGVGGKFFLDERFFLGGEARARLSYGEYTYTARVGNASISDLQSTWSLSGLNVLFFGGVRL